MRNPLRTIGVACVALLCVSWGLSAPVHGAGRVSPLLVSPPMSGGDLFRFYCASCHGREGKGDGPVARALVRPPADLTTIARRNRGLFPADRVERFVTGEREPTLAHGPRTMPVWGPVFQPLDRQDTLNRIRIANVVAFIESIQNK